jgi:hypothetical protein
MPILIHRIGAIVLSLLEIRLLLLKTTVVRESAITVSVSRLRRVLTIVPICMCVTATPSLVRKVLRRWSQRDLFSNYIKRDYINRNKINDLLWLI